MKIENISNNNFQGKVILDKYLSKSEKNFVKNILNHKVDGVKNKELLNEKDFDIHFYSRNTRKTVHPKVKLSSCLKFLKRGGYNSFIYQSSEIKYDNGIEQGAKDLRAFIENTEKFITDHLPTYYYNSRQKLGAKWKLFRGKI